MKLAWFRLVAFVILTHALVWAQHSSDGSSPALAYEDGRIENNIYMNECFGFSFAIPDDWEMNTQLVGADGKAGFTAQWQLYLLQLEHREHEGGHSFSSEVTLKARLSVPSNMTAQEFVSNTVHAQIDVVDRESGHSWKLVRDTYEVEYGGRSFSRADYKEIVKGDNKYTPIYFALVYTKFRGNFIGGAVRALSLELLDHSANILENISFQKDEPNPKCVVAGGRGYPPGYNFPAPDTSPSK